MTPAQPTSDRGIRVAFVIDELRPGAGTENQLLLLLSRACTGTLQLGDWM